MKLIVGLGNPGREYARSRHNTGFACLNYFARLHAICLDRKQCHARIGTGEVAGEQVLLARPFTFVNLSGTAVRCLMRKYNVSLNDLLVVYDDLDLQPGKVRLRVGGGSGGHNGMKSIIAALGSGDFPRVRVGIGRPYRSRETSFMSEDSIVNYVLSEFSAAEKEAVKEAIARTAEVINCFLTEGAEEAMNRFN